MTLGDLDEATGILTTLLTTLLGTLTGQVGRQGAELRYAVGDLQATAAVALQTSALGAPLINCFTLATQAGATVDGMDAVRIALQVEAPLGLAGIAVANAGIRLALCEEARILAATTFTSSQDVFAALTQQNTGFEAAQDYAADHRDPANYQALVALQAAVTRDLTTRAISLPSIVTYALRRVLTTHALANRLYGDASRADELRLENKIINPAFSPPGGTALSE